MTAVIIAGGKGTRLAEYTKEIPKPMIPIGGKPVLEYQIEEFRRYGVRDIIITVGYLKEAIIEYFGDGSRFGVSIRYVEEQEPLGSAGAFYYLKEMVGENFFVAYGDVLFSISLTRMMDFHLATKASATIFVHPNSHPHDSDLVICDEKGKVLEFNRKKSNREGIFYHNCVNAGFFIFRKETLEYFMKPEKLDLEKDFLTALIGQGSVGAYYSSEYIKDMGTYERLDAVEGNLRSGMIQKRNLDQPQKCIFLDRDGTINVHKGLIDQPEMIELESGAAKAIKKINDSGYLAVVITNQPIIARGMCSLEELERIHQKLEMLLGEKGAYLDGIYFCPHHPDSGYEGERKEYKIACQCRKPGTELIERAAEQFHIDLSKSWFIGDTTMDIQTGINAGLKTALVLTGEAGKDGKFDVTSDFVCSNLGEAIERILEQKNLE